MCLGEEGRRDVGVRDAWKEMESSEARQRPGKLYTLRVHDVGNCILIQAQVAETEILGGSTQWSTDSAHMRII